MSPWNPRSHHEVAAALAVVVVAALALAAWNMDLVALGGIQGAGSTSSSHGDTRQGLAKDTENPVDPNSSPHLSRPPSCDTALLQQHSQRQRLWLLAPLCPALVQAQESTQPPGTDTRQPTNTHAPAQILVSIPCSSGGVTVGLVVHFAVCISA